MARKVELIVPGGPGNCLITSNGHGSVFVSGIL
jgi:hypothetical protein